MQPAGMTLDAVRAPLTVYASLGVHGHPQRGTSILHKHSTGLYGYPKGTPQAGEPIWVMQFAVAAIKT